MVCLVILYFGVVVLQDNDYSQHAGASAQNWPQVKTSEGGNPILGIWRHPSLQYFPEIFSYCKGGFPAIPENGIFQGVYKHAASQKKQCYFFRYQIVQFKMTHKIIRCKLSGC